MNVEGSKEACAVPDRSRLLHICSPSVRTPCAPRGTYVRPDAQLWCRRHRTRDAKSDISASFFGTFFWRDIRGRRSDAHQPVFAQPDINKASADTNVPSPGPDVPWPGPQTAPRRLHWFPRKPLPSKARELNVPPLITEHQNVFQPRYLPEMSRQGSNPHRIQQNPAFLSL